jgi:putative oxidoreductase
MKKLFSWKSSGASLNIGLLLFRLLFAGMMIPIGYQKLTGYSAMLSPDAQYAWHDPFGISDPISLALVIFAEFFCACLIVLGLLTRLACIPLIITMAVVVFKIDHGEMFTKNGLSPAAMYLFGYIAILLAGPGKISLDATISK